MHTLTIKKVPSIVYEGLKLRADKNHRSLNKEVIAILDKTLSGHRVEPERFLAETELMRRRTKKSLNDDLLRQYREEGRS